MLRSLVGSEMCIRDRPSLTPGKKKTHFKHKNKVQPYLLHSDSNDVACKETEPNKFEEMTIDQILGFISHIYRRVEGHNVCEIVIDFLPNEKHEWVFFKCKAVRTCSEESKNRLDILYNTQTSSIVEESLSDHSIEINSNIKVLKRRLSELEKRQKNFPKALFKLESKNSLRFRHSSNVCLLYTSPSPRDS